MIKCTCVDCMYGGNIGSEHGGTNLPSSEKGDNKMSEVNPRDFMVCDPENGNGYVMPSDIKRSIGSGGSLGIPAGRDWLGAPTHITAYVVKTDAKEYYVTTKEKALQIVSEMLDCEGKVEIKRIELI